MGRAEALRQAVRAQLLELQDQGYAQFTAGLIPTMARERIIGVRMPALRALARRFPFEGGPEAYLQLLPHHYHEEHLLHAFLIERLKGYELCLKHLGAFLPHVDNWATCDSLKPAALLKEPQRFREELLRWLDSEHLYTQRFAIVNLMGRYLDRHFQPELLHRVSGIQSDAYYIQMAQAWYLCEALAKQYQLALPLLEEGSLGRCVHNKAIQKAVESRQFTPEQKAHLRSLRRKA